MDKIKIVVCGACGKVGSRIISFAEADPQFEVIGGVERKGFSTESMKNICDDLSNIISSCDVVIDFTSPKATLEHLEVVEKNKKSFIIGTTGLESKDIQRVQSASKNIPVVFSPNMSIGVNILFKLAHEITKTIPNYDIEIVELHHNQKKDSPSGTAVKLSEIIAETLNRDIKKVGIYGRKGVIGQRKKEEIGVMAVRAGDIVGEHTVYFAGPGERIELTHRAHSRDTFASGALTAAKWIVKQKPGLYNMQNVLNI